MQQEAEADFVSGRHANRALERLGAGAWERACFRALRDVLRRAWAPRDEVEAMLIDELAQYELIRRQWIGNLAVRARDPRTLSSLGRTTEDDDDCRLTRAAATQQTLQMLE